MTPVPRDHLYFVMTYIKVTCVKQTPVPKDCLHNVINCNKRSTVLMKKNLIKRLLICQYQNVFSLLGEPLLENTCIKRSVSDSQYIYIAKIHSNFHCIIY